MENNNRVDETGRSNASVRKALLIANCIILSIGTTGGPLMIRLYFIHGGTLVWLSCFLETAGWPFMLIPIAIAYYNRRKTLGPSAKLSFMKFRVFIPSAVIGLLTGLDDYLYAYGVARLPISTSALIIAAQLGFTAFFGFLLVKQKFTSYSLNAVVLLTIGSAVLVLNASSDRPDGVSHKQYVAGFLTTVAAAALYGFVLPLMELTYKKANQRITYALVLEIQLVMCLFATVFCTVGMLVNNDFKAIPREAEKFKLGESGYYAVLVLNAIIWQAFFLGAIGVVFCASSLLSGIIIAVLLPLTEVLAVIFYHEKFQPAKGVSLALSLWGFISYFYGEIKYNKKREKERFTNASQQTAETPQLLQP